MRLISRNSAWWRVCEDPSTFSWLSHTTISYRLASQPPVLDNMPDDRSSRHDDRRRSHRDSPDPPRRRSLSPTTPHSRLLQFNAPPLTADDYFSRSYEFKSWLLSRKSLYLDEISSQEARRYFSRFVRYWNDGRLPDEYYTGKLRGVGGSGGQTRHKWAFGREVEKELEKVRDSVDTLTNGMSRGAREARDVERKSRGASHADEGVAERDSGWSSAGKSHADRQLDREHNQNIHRIAQQERRQRTRQEAADAHEELHGARATGRDRMIEKRRERNEGNRAFADRHEDGLEVDERDLYDDPHPTITERGRGESKREQVRRERAEEKRADLEERVGKLKEKDERTMEMFKAMAAERFGGAS